MPASVSDALCPRKSHRGIFSYHYAHWALPIWKQNNTIHLYLFYGRPNCTHNTYFEKSWQIDTCAIYRQKAILYCYYISNSLQRNCLSNFLCFWKKEKHRPFLFVSSLIFIDITGIGTACGRRYCVGKITNNNWLLFHICSDTTVEIGWKEQPWISTMPGILFNESEVDKKKIIQITWNSPFVLHEKKLFTTWTTFSYFYVSELSSNNREFIHFQTLCETLTRFTWKSLTFHEKLLRTFTTYSFVILLENCPLGKLRNATLSFSTTRA